MTNHNYKNLNMYLNVKLQELSIILEKFRRVFSKFQGFNDFLEIMNYFSLEKGID
jgi:hypothetical protein